MNNTLHTPGPWKYDSTWALIMHGKSEICALHSGNPANAHLISAAPDLLSAAKSALRALRSYNPGPLADKADPVRTAIIAAIAKAEGREA